MKDNLIEVVCVLDRSGSMAGIARETIEGFNTYTASLMRLGPLMDVRLTLVIFDDKRDIVHESLPIRDLPPLTDKTYFARGNTALLDALGWAIARTGDRLNNTPEIDKPSKVIFFVATDGQENASNEYTLQQVADMVKLQTETYKWEFIFAGANIDAFGAAGSLGMKAANTTNYQPSALGTRALYSSLSVVTQSVASADADNAPSFAEVLKAETEKLINGGST